jgi:hypothetical protein
MELRSGRLSNRASCVSTLQGCITCTSSIVPQTVDGCTWRDVGFDGAPVAVCIVAVVKTPLLSRCCWRVVRDTRSGSI